MEFVVQYVVDIIAVVVAVIQCLVYVGTASYEEGKQPYKQFIRLF